MFRHAGVVCLCASRGLLYPRPYGRKKPVNRAPIAGGGEVRHNLQSKLESAVTAPPLVGCVVWSQ